MNFNYLFEFKMDNQNTLSDKFEIPAYQLAKQGEIIQQVREGTYEP